MAAKAKLVQLRGDIDGAMKMFSDLLINTPAFAHKVLHLELMFSNALKSNWDEAIKYAELLRNGTVHSPAMATYAEAILRYAKGCEENDGAQKQKATQLLKYVIRIVSMIVSVIGKHFFNDRTVPELRIRHLGKTLTPEKIAIENSIKYMKNNEFLILPEMV